MYSEKTQRALDRYTRKLVRCQPRWLRELFNSERIVFVMEEDGTLGVHATKTVSKELQCKAANKIVQYLDANPCPAFSALKVH